MIDDILGFAGKRVVVSGCASGMGAATAALLAWLGAEVHGLDLRDPVAIDDAVAALGGRVDALFNCAGLGPTFSPLDIVKVNFIGTRHLTGRVLPLMGQGSTIASIASTTAMGWSGRLDTHRAFLATGGYDAAVEWVAANAGTVSEGYAFSKEAVVVWTLAEAPRLIARGIRINCVLPGLTETPMLRDQIAVDTAAAVLDRVIRPIGRAAMPAEQAFPLVMLASPLASYVNGAALDVDGGRLATLTVG